MHKTYDFIKHEIIGEMNNYCIKVLWEGNPMLRKNVKNKKAKVVVVFIELFIMLSIVMNLRGHLVIKKGVVLRYRVGIIDRVKKEITNY